MATKTNHYVLPDANIQSNGLKPGAFSKAAAIDLSRAAPRAVSKEEEIYKSADMEMIRGDIEDYYNRGINILKPEIVLSSEFVPIRKDFDDSPGLQLQLGDKRINVNQVFKLIELHHSVQKSVNIASIEFLESETGIDIKSFYEAAKTEFKLFNNLIATLETQKSQYSWIYKFNVHILGLNWLSRSTFRHLNMLFNTYEVTTSGKRAIGSTLRAFTKNKISFIGSQEINEFGVYEAMYY